MEAPEILTADALVELIENGDCNDWNTAARVHQALETHPELLAAENVERAIGKRLNLLVVQAKAAEHRKEMSYLDTLFSRIQSAKQGTNSSPKV